MSITMAAPASVQRHYQDQDGNTEEVCTMTHHSQFCKLHSWPSASPSTIHLSQWVEGRVVLNILLQKWEHGPCNHLEQRHARHRKTMFVNYNTSSVPTWGRNTQRGKICNALNDSQQNERLYDDCKEPIRLLIKARVQSKNSSIHSLTTQVAMPTQVWQSTEPHFHTETLPCRLPALKLVQRWCRFHVRKS